MRVSITIDLDDLAKRVAVGTEPEAPPDEAETPPKRTSRKRRFVHGENDLAHFRKGKKDDIADEAAASVEDIIRRHRRVTGRQRWARAIEEEE